MKVLIVDDSTAMRSIVRRTLRQAGYGEWEVVEARNGREALEAIFRETPDLVLSDWNMPEMGGLELLQAARAAGSRVNFGFITSEGTPAFRHQAAESGALFLVTKPFSPDALQKVLSAFVPGA
jgi:two-component system, chemotaxis family, chemotaxis protein CheY